MCIFSKLQSTGIFVLAGGPGSTAVTDFVAAMAAATSIGADVDIRLDINDAIVLQGVQDFQLHADDFPI